MVDPRYFTRVNGLGIKNGDPVRNPKTGEVGLVSLIWYGVDEVVTVVLADGSKAHWHPALGEVEALDG